MTTYELIEKRLEELNMKRSEFVMNAWGYKNINKGMRKYLEMKEGTLIDIKDIKNIARVLQISEEEVVESMIENERENEMKRQKIRNEERKKFVPHFYSMHERTIPSPIFIGCIFNLKRYVYYYQGFEKRPLKEQLVSVKFDIIEHYRFCEGEVGGFGKIIYYVYRNDYDAGAKDLITLTIKGEVIENKEGLRLEPGHGVLSLKKNGPSLDSLFEIKKQIIDRRN
ncbi:MAG: hypothetical protein JXA68_09740 [Ignavibacteriales bacterium]|nr:hypothetical protein [Ignavibacteriales bacterium]